MNWLNYQLNLMPAPDVILHIGAGLCSELPDYQPINPGRIILIEPNPETFNALRQKTADCDNVTVLNAAVASEAGRARLRRFNFPELDSLREPTGLYKLLPGLQQIDQVEVSTITPLQLIRRLGLRDSGNNWLILEAPGEETMVLEELNRIEALRNFSRLIIRTGAEPFYEGYSASGPLLERLESFCYFVEAIPDENDPDWPRFHLKFQPLAHKCRELETQLEQSHEQLAETRDENCAKTREINALKSRMTELEKERNALIADIVSYNEKSENQSKQNEHLQQALNKKQNELDSARSDLALAIRLQTLRENDLKELQTRYGEVLTIKDEQQDLLTQLHHRLSRAAEYLKLQAQSEEKSLPDELLEALTGNDEKTG